MASKRNLYKPAPQENVGNRERRKPLAQGRLVTKSESADMKPFNYDGSYLANMSVDASHLSANLEKPAGRYLDTNPRRDTSSFLATASPQPVRPSHMLELSDTDSDMSFQLSMYRSDQDKPIGGVVVVDATRKTKDPNQSEVDIRLGYENSPVKVICHSPSIVKSNLRNTGDTAQARKVCVDQVPSISIMSTDGSGRERASHARQMLGKSPLVVREKGLSVGTPDRESRARVVHVDTSRGQLTPVRPSNTVKHPEYRQPRIMDMNVDQHESHESSRESVDTIVQDAAQHDRKAQTTHKPVIMSKASPKRDKEKKKKVERIVASRYMQSVKASVQQAEQSTLAKSVVKGKHAMKASSKSEVVPKSRRAAKRSTPVSVKSTSHMTSTPTINDPLLPADGSIDASAIAPPPKSSIYSTPNALDNSGVSSIGNLSGDHIAFRLGGAPGGGHRSSGGYHPRNMSCDSIMSTGSTGSMDSTYAGGATSHKKSLAANQEQLELEYAVYLQWLYMTRMAEKAAREQSKQAMEQLHGLWEENQQLRKKHADLKSDQAKLTNANMLDDMLNRQESGLGPVVQHLGSLQQQYSGLAHALDTTRHQVQTKAIHVPDDEQNYQDALLNALRESEQLLGELGSMTRPNQSQLTAFAAALSALDQTIQSEEQEIAKCTDMLTSFQSLTTQESSLRIQQIQASG